MYQSNFVKRPDPCTCHYKRRLGLYDLSGKVARVVVNSSQVLKDGVDSGQDANVGVKVNIHQPAKAGGRKSCSSNEDSENIAVNPDFSGSDNLLYFTEDVLLGNSGADVVTDSLDNPSHPCTEENGPVTTGRDNPAPDAQEVQQNPNAEKKSIFSKPNTTADPLCTILKVSCSLLFFVKFNNISDKFSPFIRKGRPCLRKTSYRLTLCRT
jgi:hypothetical protein